MNGKLVTGLVFATVVVVTVGLTTAHPYGMGYGYGMPVGMPMMGWGWNPYGFQYGSQYSQENYENLNETYPPPAWPNYLNYHGWHCPMMGW